MPDWIILILLLVLIALSAFFSASEIVYASANRMRLRNDAQEGKSKSKLAEFIMDHYTDSLSTILVGNNLVNIAASSAMTVFATRHWGAAGAGIGAVCITIALLIFGETMPKILGRENADALAPALAGMLRLCMYLFWPLVTVVSLLVEKLSVLWTPKEARVSVTTEELVTLLDTIEEEGVFSERESDIIKSAIEFGDVDARDIMMPRVDVTAWDMDDGLEALLANEDAMSYSRIPVYQESIDNIVGILSTKKLLKLLVAGEQPTFEDVLTEPFFVHMTRSITSILMEFRKRHTQMAIVVDEFGGTMGILTMEDIAEEIMGEIYDESDEQESPIAQQPDGSYLVDGSVSIDDVFDALDYEPQDFDSDYTTIGGWLTELLDRFPAAGDSASFGRIDMTVLSAQSMRVDQVKVTLQPPEDEEEE